MGNSYLEDKYEDYELIAPRLPSARELIETLDDRFNFYLLQRKRKTAWTPILRKKPLSSVVTSLVIDIDFTDEKIVSETEFKALVIRMHSCISDLTNDQKYLKNARQMNCTPLEAAAREVFNSQKITLDMAYDIEGFYISLLEMFFRKKENPMQQRRIQLEQLSLALPSLLTSITHFFQSEPEQEKIIHHSLLELFTQNLDPHIIESIFHNIIDCLESNAATLKAIQDIFEKQAPICWIKNVINEKVKVVILGEGEEKWAAIVPPDNFYFTDSDSDDLGDYNSDELPLPCSIQPRHKYHLLLAGKDCSLFLPNGVKVYWGDLIPENATKLTGRYYALTQSDSFHDIPNCAKVLSAIRPAPEPDAYPDVMRFTRQPIDIPVVDPSYIKLMAVCKIQNGQVILNRKKVVI